MSKKTARKDLRTKKTGQSLVEMALFLMIILYILGAAVNFGIAYLSYVAIRDAAPEGVVYGTIHPPYSNAELLAIEDRIKRSASTPVDLYGEAVDITVTTPDGTDAGNSITVTVVYEYPVLLPFVNLLIGTNPSCGSCIPLKAKATGVILVNPPTP